MSIFSISLAIIPCARNIAIDYRYHPTVSEPFVAHLIRSFTNSAERLAARNSRIKVNFARLTHNQCFTRAPTLTRADPRLSPRSSIPIRPLEWFPVIQHCRSTTNYMHFIARRSERCNSKRGRAISRYRARSRCFILVFRIATYRGEKQKYGTTSLEQWCGFRYVRTHGNCGRSVGRPQRDHAGGTTRSFRGLKNFTAGIIVMTRAASNISRFSLIPRRPSRSLSSHFVSLSVFLS